MELHEKLIKIKEFVQQETVFCASLFLAVLSAFAVRPDRAYLAYPDYRTLSLLFCLMLIVAGLRSLGIFEMLGQSLLGWAGSLRSLSLVLVLLCFFSSMIITNDVTLITFIPFTLLVFRMIRRDERVLTLVVLETIAANLGSMATPIGNPQNLYLFSSAGLTMGQFAAAVFPYAGLALLLLVAALVLQKNEPLGKEAGTAVSAREEEKGKLLVSLLPFLALLALCLLVVFRVCSYGPVLACVVAVVLAVNRKLFRSVDYYLLLTFLCFFIFIGNLKRIPELNTLLVSLVQGHELLAGILASQFISNVPAAILLSGFTKNIGALVTAVNLGGLGTLIASLASLIAFKYYAAEYPGKKGAFLAVFTLWNGGFLLILCGAAAALTL